jgi:hypothetical protein
MLPQALFLFNSSNYRQHKIRNTTEVFMSIDKPGKDMRRTVNPGDRISDEPQSIEEKAQQLAVDHVPDITGDVVTVPTYFIVEEPDGEKKALHHVKDAEEISDVVRQMRVDENGDRIWD